ncbi:MAG: DUF2723 domain-containing protein [Candidatus Coatesbacteria bacterium]|nr:MAG: DUF2723 domain-containing protein [Candidatus Coatesbacteria bacterium]
MLSVNDNSKTCNPRNKYFAAGLALSFFVPLVVYLITLAPTLSFEDSAEFAIGGAVLGVNHPSGYPLQTLTCHLFTYFPAGEVAWRINLSSAVAGAAAATFLFLLTWEFLAGVVGDRRLLAAASWAAGGLFAFSRSFWPQAVITEVYALQAALFAATLWCAARCRRGGDVRWFYATAFAAAVAAANHPLSLVATAPLLAYLWFRLRREEGHGAALAVAGSLFLILGLSIYLYLALRASRDPLINWGAPADLSRLLDHVRRREFGTIFWPRYRYLGYHTVELAKFLGLQFGPGVGVLALGGAAWALVRKVRFGGVLAVLALLTGPVTMLTLVGLLTPFQVFEIEVWYLAFFMLAAAFVAGGGAALIGALKWRGAAVAATAALAALPLYPALYNGRFPDRAARSFAFEHGRNLLRTFPYRALLAFPFYGRQGLYVQTYSRAVHLKRPDLVLADPRNTIRSELPSLARAPIYMDDPNGAEEWYFDYRRTLLATTDRRFFYNLKESYAAAWGASLEPYGLHYWARRGGEERPFGGPPWKRYEYNAFAALGRDPPAAGQLYSPTAYRLWADYYLKAAEYAGDRGREIAFRRNLAAAERLAAYDPELGCLLASIYNEYGYPEKAVELYHACLPAMERYRHDALMGRSEYASYLKNLATAYLKMGDISSAQRYFEESVAVNPEQTELAAHLSYEELAEAAALFQRERK